MAECNINPHHLIYHLCVSKLYVWTNLRLRVDLAPNITEGARGALSFDVMNIEELPTLQMRQQKVTPSSLDIMQLLQFEFVPIFYAW
jgi:hypothetical protein